MQYLDESGNVLYEVNDSDKIFKMVNGKISGLAGTGSRVVVADASGNLSASDLKISFTPVISSDSGTIPSYTVSSCYVAKMGKLIRQTAQIIIADKGTGAGDLIMSLFSHCATTGVCVGQNTGVGTALMGVCSGSFSIFRKVDGTTPISNNVFILTAEYYDA